MSGEVTRILEAIETGDRQAAGQLLPLVYDELRRLASRKMKQEKPGQTLQATALVHEAYLRLLDGESQRHWDGRAHFFAAAAEAMRRILIEGARRRQSEKHGGGRVKHTLSDEEPVDGGVDLETLLSLDEALTQLAAVDADLAKLVELRYFAGFTVDEAARTLGISPRTAKRDWTYARAWLRRAMDGDAE